MPCTTTRRVAVHVQFIAVAPAGSESLIVAPVTVDGPGVADGDGVRGVGCRASPSSSRRTWSTTRLAWATTVVVSVALLSAGLSIVPGGAVTVAVFDSTPVNAGVDGAVDREGRRTARGQVDRGVDVAAVGPALSQLPPPEATHVQRRVGERCGQHVGDGGVDHRGRAGVEDGDRVASTTCRPRRWSGRRSC